MSLVTMSEMSLVTGRHLRGPRSCWLPAILSGMHPVGRADQASHVIVPNQSAPPDKRWSIFGTFRAERS